jgi:hypothetical protein
MASLARVPKIQIYNIYEANTKNKFVQHCSES